MKARRHRFGDGRLALSAVLAVALGAAAPSPAEARDATIDEVSTIAAEAITDLEARGELAAVTSIDGAPVDLGATLSGSEEEVRQRLRTLAALTPNPGVRSPADARDQANDIVSQPEYQQGDAAFDEGLFGRLVRWIVDVVPDPLAAAFGSVGLWIVVAIIVIAAAVLSAVQGRRRRRQPSAGITDPSLTPRLDDPRDLEAAARRAARDGDHSTAVRLWFRAGAGRLAALGAIEREATATSGAVRRAVRSPIVDGLVATFDLVAYGGYEAEQQDAADAAAGWASLDLDKVGERG